MKHSLARRATLFLAVLFLAGCSGTPALREAILGRQNPLESLDAATLGRTTRDEIMTHFGAPDEIDQRWFDSHEAEIFVYLDDRAVDEEGDPQTRVLACEFEKGVLNGYTFQVSGGDPAAGFDDAARGKLAKGATRSQVEALLGKPQGKSLLPTTLTVGALDSGLGGVPAPLAGLPAGAKEVWFYSVQGLDDALHRDRQRSLLVYFDDKGGYLGQAWFQQLVSKSNF